MVTMKATGGSSLNGATRRTTNNPDHWAFLAEIDAPSWVDLTLEAQLMHQDIDDAWFRTSHPIHEMPARRLKSRFPYCSKNLMLPDLSCPSPVLPDSVSRSRGKDYSRKLEGGEHLMSNSLHPIRKLDGKTVAEQHASRKNLFSNTSCTVTTSSSGKNTLSYVIDSTRSSSSKSSSTVNTDSVSSVVSKHASLKGNLRVYGPSRSKTTCSRDSIATDCSSQSVSEGKKLPPSLRSSSSKSIVGSSYNLECKLEGIDSAALPKDNKNIQRHKDSKLAMILKDSKSEFPDRVATCKTQKKAGDAKIAPQEQKLKGSSSAPFRKPLQPVNEMPTKVRSVTLATQPRQSVSSGNVNSDPKALRHNGTRLASRNGLSHCKGKPNEAKREANLRTVAVRPFR